MATKKTPAKSAAKTAAKTGANAVAKRLTKTEIVRRIAETTQLAPKQVNTVFNALVEMAVKEAKKNGEFIVPGFGKLVKAQRAARMGRNPLTGEAIKIKAKTAVKFRISKTIKDAIAPPKN